MQNYLVVTALIENSSDIIRTFSKLSKTSGCNVVDSHFSVIGEQISITLFLSGTWDAIAKMEAMLDKLGKQHETQILTKRTPLETMNGDAMPYAVDIVGVDQAGIIFAIAEFMSNNDLAIQEMSSNTYLASQTGTKMFALHMAINLPLDASIAAIRGDFIDFCDQLNLDAIMEPVK